MEIKLGEIKYEKTEDKNIINKYYLMQEKINIDRLALEIKDLETIIESISKPKIKPDVETLNYWNDQVFEDKDILEQELAEKKKYLAAIVGV